MPHRAQLRCYLCQAWRETIEGPYRAQQINSERALQAHFCAKLLPLIEGSKRRLFIEPRIHLQGRKRPVFPDVLICSQRAVIAAIELKYVPRKIPKTNGDLTKLRSFSHSEASFNIANDRFRGRRSKMVDYKLAKNALVCWAGVYTGKEIQLILSEKSKLNRKLLVMHAITEEGRDAEIKYCGFDINACRHEPDGLR